VNENHPIFSFFRTPVYGFAALKTFHLLRTARSVPHENPEITENINNLTGIYAR